MSPAETMTAIPDAAHYDQDYVGTTRVHSYAHALSAALTLRPRTALEVGVGTGIVAHALSALGVRVTTLDVEASLSPDLLADVCEIPVDDGAFDVALCCQVLEHLPFERFVPALRELRRVTTRGLVLSVPDQDRYLALRATLPKLGQVNWWWSLPRLRPTPVPKRRFDEMGHYWEIGFAGTSRRQVLSAIGSAGWCVAREWRVPELSWHHFFVLEAARGNG